MPERGRASLRVERYRDAGQRAESLVADAEESITPVVLRLVAKAIEANDFDAGVFEVEFHDAIGILRAESTSVANAGLVGFGGIARGDAVLAAPWMFAKAVARMSRRHAEKYSDIFFVSD